MEIKGQFQNKTTQTNKLKRNNPYLVETTGPLPAPFKSQLLEDMNLP